MTKRRRQRDGAGWGPNGWIKHALIKRVMGGQVTVLRRKFGENGVIIDMHAGTGEGIEIGYGNLDLFRDNVSDATAALACRFARESTPPAKVMLCESRPVRREILRQLYGTQAEIVTSNSLLMRRDLSGYSWAVVLNDPCGPSGHAVEVMQRIAVEIPASDFVININESALSRLAGVRREAADHGPNAALVQAVRAKAAEYAWMLDHNQWKQKLGKDFVYSALTTVNHRAMRGRIILVANYVTDGVRRMFEMKGHLT